MEDFKYTEEQLKNKIKIQIYGDLNVAGFDIPEGAKDIISYNIDEYIKIDNIQSSILQCNESYLKEDLIIMMTNYWALDNNEECHEQTIKFCKKYDIDLDEINISEEYDYE